MNSKNKWLGLFAFGLTLVILTSVSTATFILKLTEDKVQSANRQLESQKAAGGMTQQTALLNLSSGSGQTQLTDRGETSASQPTSATSSSPTSSTSSATTESGSVAPTESTKVQKTNPSLVATQQPKQSESAKVIDVVGSASVNPSATTKNASGSTTIPVKYITATRARQIILDRIGTANLRVVEIELKSDYPPMYEIKLVDGKYKYDTKVHAVTGLVIEIDKEESDD